MSSREKISIAVILACMIAVAGAILLRTHQSGQVSVQNLSSGDLQVQGRIPSPAQSGARYGTPSLKFAQEPSGNTVQRSPYYAANKDSAKMAQRFAQAVYDGSLSDLQGELSPSLFRNAYRWLPQVSSDLKSKFGNIKDVQFEITDQPAPGWVATQWRVYANRGTFEMRVERKPDGRVGHLEFRASPSDHYHWQP
jgi:hypothetical protein